MQVGQYVRVHRRVPFFGGRVCLLHKLGKRSAQVILGNGIILDILSENLVRTAR